MPPSISLISRKPIRGLSKSDSRRLGRILSSGAGIIEHLRTSKGSLVAITSAGLYRFPPGDILSVAPKGGIETVRGIAREEGRWYSRQLRGLGRD